MKVKNRKISLAVCSLLAMASIVGGAYSVSNVQDVAAEGVVAEYIATDTETKSAWESAGYGTNGYLIMGANASSKAAAYSNMYTEQGNDGKTEITMTRGGDTYWYYDSACTISTDSTAPISGFMLNGSSIWQGGNQSKTSYLYIPGTETTYPGRIHNNMTSVYRDFGLGFNLRETEKTYVSVYVSDWNGKASESLPITVGLYSGIKTATIQGYSSGGVVDRTTSMADHYGTALAETTLTTGAGAYVTFAIEGAGDYQIVAYYNNQDASTDSSIIPMFSGLFFDKDGFEDEEIVPPTIEVSLDTETQSAWESAGYGTNGYLIMGANASNKAAAYSNMYTEQGNDGKTEITMTRGGDTYWYYDSACTISTDSTAPISGFMLNGSSIWQNGNQSKTSYLYIPGTETTYPGRIHNNMTSVYRDFGLGFNLRETEKTYVSVYVSDWNGKASESLPITVGLYSGIKTATIQGYSSGGVVNRTTSMTDHYGTALAETTLTTGAGVYVTFAIEGAGDYQIVAYYNNQDASTDASIIPMFSGLFFDKDGFEDEEIVPPTIEVSLDTETKSAWESAGYGTDGYMVFGVNTSNKPAVYSNMYTKQDNDGKTEITLYKHTDNSYYYDSNLTTTDSTAPISKFVVNGQSAWQTISAYWADQPDLYAPGTETLESVRMHNNHDGDAYHDFGIGFTLTTTEKICVTAYVLDWGKSISQPITVGLYSGIKNTTVYGYGNNTATTLVGHYGKPLVTTTVTSQGTYVTFAIEEAGDYQIVAYYDNEGTSNATVTPMITGLFFDEPEPALPEITTSVFVDTTSKSAWEANGYGTDGYLVLGGVTAYSNMYTERGNDGKTEISLYKHGNNSIYYNSTMESTDSTAPISGFVVNGSSAWQAPTGTYWVSQPDLYIPGTETTYPVRLHNNIAGLYSDFGLGFTLRETEKIYVTAYILDWGKSVSQPITVGLYSGIKNTTVYGYGNNTATTVDEHYGTALVETTVTTQGAYVTFAIEGAGDYQIVAYYDNQGTSNATVTPMITGLFFDKEIYPEVTSTSLSLDGDISVNYYVGARGQDLAGGYLQVKYANGNIQQVPVPDRNTDGTYKFQVKIAAKDYAAKMKVRLFDEAGNAISKAFTYSAASYVKSILSAGAAVYGEKLVALATALNDYGKAAENLLYGESNTFTADLSTVTTSTLAAHKFSVSGSLPVGVKLSDFSLSLKATTSLKIYFTATSLDDVVCKVGDTVVEPEATGAVNEYCIVIENINAKDLDTNYVVSIGDYQLTLSALSYSLRALEYSSNVNLKTAMQALYLYNQAANAYFEEA